MRQIQLNIYEFEDLSNEAKEAAIEHFKERVQDFHFDWLEEDMQERLASNYNIKDVELNYSLSYSQGDGVCFYTNRNILSYTALKNADKTSLNAFERYCIENLSEDELELLKTYLNEDYKIFIKRGSSNYCHCYTCRVDYEYYYSDNTEEEDKMNKFIDNLCEKLFENVYIEICGDLEEFGYSYYEVEDEEVIDFIEANGIEFLEDGSVYA